jgi:N-acyl-D-amino-acid deacylase
MGTYFDWIIRSGRIIDGTGNPWYRADIGIKSGCISVIGSLDGQEAGGTVDARGRIVCPGFIDAHSHSESIILRDPVNLPKLSQGITTEIVGQDGISFMPLSSRSAALVDEMWQGINGRNPLNSQVDSFHELIQQIDQRTSANTAYLIPHSTIRMEVMGISKREASSQEIAGMERWINQLMADGCIGISTGLTYWPECYTPTQELVELCRAAAGYGGIYVTHLRSYGDSIFKAIEEAIAIGDQAGIPVHISHLNYDDERIVQLIDQGRQKGVDITFDLYPYLAGTTLLLQYLPDFIYGNSLDETIERLDSQAMRQSLEDYRRATGAAWDNLLLCNAELVGQPRVAGLTLAEAAAQSSRDTINFICDLLVESRLSATAIQFAANRSEAGLIRLMQHPAQMFCSDAVLVGAAPRPRTHGSFPRVFGCYVRENQALTLEEAVRKMTSFPAARHGLTGRGLLRPGMAADIVIFDPDTILDQADFKVGNRLSKGIEYVWVNGELVLDPSGPTGRTPGRFLPYRKVVV